MLSASFLAAVDAELADSDARLNRLYPGPAAGRQPVHTVYVPADRLSDDPAATWGSAALDALDEHGGTAAEFGALTGLESADAAAIVDRVRAKLVAEPIEDLRIDLEDGYGLLSDAEEDSHVGAAVQTVLAAVEAGTLPPFVGFRIKSFQPETRRRGISSLDAIISSLASSGRVDATWLSASLRITLPKVTSVDQVRAMVQVCGELEQLAGLPDGTLRFEIQVETPQAIMAADGTAQITAMVHAAGDRCIGLHYGTYDYSTSLGIGPAQQSMEHPVADHAKLVMQLAAAGTGVAVSDGSTNIVPTGTAAEVRAAWQLHGRLVRRSLERGIYQGWDLHPAQLVTRFAATYGFYRSGRSAAAARLRNYLAGAAGGFMDEPATARSLAGYLHRGVTCGAFDASDLTDDGIEPAVVTELAT